MDPTIRLESYLSDLAARAAPGSRLPTIRQLMAQFGTSQARVQRAIATLKDNNHIRAEIGRGTYFIGRPARSPGQHSDAAMPQRTRSVLILRRSISTRRVQAVAEGLQNRLTADGHSVVDVAYSDMRSVGRILEGLPQFDACVLHSSFDAVSIEILGAMHQKTAVIVVDGAALAGLTVDAVGVKWGESVERALTRLRERGHRGVGLVVTAHHLLAVELGKRRFLALTEAAPPCPVLHIPAWPFQNYEDLAIQQILSRRLDDGRFPFTALIVWGVEDGAQFRKRLAEHGIDVPASLSVICIGRTDLETEHDRFFTVIGIRVEDQVAGLYQAIYRRWSDPQSDYTMQFLPSFTREGDSVAAPPPRRDHLAAAVIHGFVTNHRLRL